MFLEAVVTAFVATQLWYFVCNCGLLALFLRRPANPVDERTLGRVLEAAARREGDRRERIVEDDSLAHADGGRRTATQYSTRSDAAIDADPASSPGPTPDPTDDDGPGPRCRLPESHRRRIHVFVPVARDRWRPLERTLESLAAGSYPAGSITVYPVLESPDPSPAELTGGIAPNRPPGLEVVPIDASGRPDEREDGAPERGDAPAPDGADLAWAFEGPDLPRATAATVADAYARQPIAADDVVTVLEAGSWVPVDAVELAVAGLVEYDVVRAKRTVFDVDRGMLPLLESMGTAVRSDLGTGSSAGPYHLSGTGSFLEAGTLADLDRWRRGTGADAWLGMTASRRGHALGVLDRYVQVPCPTALETWLREKRGRVRRLYRDVFARGWAGVDDLRRWSGTLLLQSLAVVSLVGLPAAALAVLLTAGGADAATLSTPLWLLVGFNALVWAYCSVRAYRAARSAVPFRSRWHGAAYSVLANPLSQALYVTLWAVPISLGLVDLVRGGD